jgi:hypothetical protein
MVMMKIEDTVNDIVLAVLREPEMMERVGIASQDFYARVVGYDEYGIWLEHPNFEVIFSEDERGKPLPPDKVQREHIDASVYVPWGNIATLVHFPHREGFDFPSPFRKPIGFEATREHTDAKEE